MSPALTIGIAGENMGMAPLGVGGPGVEPLHPRIVGRWINIWQMPWTKEMLEHRAHGARPVAAPIGLFYYGRATKSVTVGARGLRGIRPPVPPPMPVFAGS